MSVLSGAVLTALCWLGGVAGNVWTTDCRVLATQRLDPIVFPGHSPAGHVHTVAAGSTRSRPTRTCSRATAPDLDRKGFKK